MGGQDMGVAPSGPGHQPFGPQPATPSSQSGVPNVVPLASLTYDRQLALTGQGYPLPRAKGASEPYYFTGGPAPVPHGTKVSVWHPRSRYWIASASGSHTWQAPCVFRVRDIGSRQPASVAMPALDRIAAALERIASAMEAAAAGETEGLDPKGDSAVAEGQTPNPQQVQP